MLFVDLYAASPSPDARKRRVVFPIHASHGSDPSTASLAVGLALSAEIPSIQLADGSVVAMPAPITEFYLWVV